MNNPESAFSYFKEGFSCSQSVRVIGVYIDNPEGMGKAKDEKIFKKVCPAFVRSAGEISDVLLKE